MYIYKYWLPFISIATGAFLFLPAEQKQIPSFDAHAAPAACLRNTHLSKNDTIPWQAMERYLVDTSLKFQDAKSLFKYQEKQSFALYNFCKNNLPGGDKIGTGPFRYDSIERYNGELFNILMIRYLQGSSKNTSDFGALGWLFEHALSVDDQIKMDLFNSFPESLRQSKAGLNMLQQRDRFKKNIGISFKTYGDQTLEITTGGSIKLSSLFEKKYNYYLIKFSASWCRPCRFENIILKDLVTKIDTSRLKIIELSGDTEKEKWSAALQEDNDPWNSFFVINGFHSPLYLRLGINSIPRNFLLNENAEIIAEHTDIKLLLKNLIHQ